MTTNKWLARLMDDVHCHPVKYGPGEREGIPVLELPPLHARGVVQRRLGVWNRGSWQKPRASTDVSQTWGSALIVA